MDAISFLAADKAETRDARLFLACHPSIKRRGPYSIYNLSIQPYSIPSLSVLLSSLPRSSILFLLLNPGSLSIKVHR
jgi:hypothetical protein